MATIGQPLTAPESGWKRYDDSDKSILYSGAWTIENSNSFYNGSQSRTVVNNFKVEFKFKGTKIRILGSIVPSANSSASSDLKLIVDGVTTTFSNIGSSLVAIGLLVEKNELEDTIHTVTIEGGVNSKGFLLDAIDINNDGYLGTLNKFLILSNDGELISFNNKVNSANLIPKMTSNTTPSGTANSSSNVVGYEAWRAFDGEPHSSRWRTGLNITTGWLSYDFKSNTKVNRYSISPSNIDIDTTQAPKNWTFEGSNNGTAWTVLDTQVNQTNWMDSSSNLITNTYEFTSNQSYPMYRLNVSSNNGNSERLSVGELQMFDFSPSFFKQLSSISEKNFISHGVDKLVKIELNEQITNKIFIEQNSTTLGNGKVFSTTIDTTKTPIKKVSIN